MFIETVIPALLEFRRNVMFIEDVSPQTLQSRRDVMFIEKRHKTLFSPVGTECL